MSDYSEDTLYSAKHVWAKPDMKTSTATVGITDYLADELMEIDSIDLPMVGDELEMESFCAHLHVHNRIHHLRAPLSGRVVELNKEVQDTPSLLHLDANTVWLFKIEFDDSDEFEQLMSGSQYAKFLDQR